MTYFEVAAGDSPHVLNLSYTLTEIGNAKNQSMIETVVHKLISRYGVKSAAYLGTGITDVSKREPYLAVTYSSEWVKHYKESRYVEIDPVIRIGMHRLLPLDWSEFSPLEGVVKTFFGEASEFGLGRNGLSIPVHGRNGDRALFTVTSDLSDRDWKQERLFYMRDFQVIAVHLHDLVLRLEGQSQPRPNLSPRELECLKWVSEGKTAWECAIILGLSEHTVRCYLESARHKLRATSNTHAVSLAHKADLFSPSL